jgi:hypothetical protein
LVARPLSIYTSGGVEKIPGKPKKVERVAQPIRPRRSEGIIKRNEDGTTSVVYPDSDDDEEVPVQPVTGEETDVIKGSYITDKTDNRTNGNRGTTKHT